MYHALNKLGPVAKEQRAWPHILNGEANIHPTHQGLLRSILGCPGFRKMMGALKRVVVFGWEFIQLRRELQTLGQTAGQSSLETEKS